MTIMVHNTSYKSLLTAGPETAAVSTNKIA